MCFYLFVSSSSSSILLRSIWTCSFSYFALCLTSSEINKNNRIDIGAIFFFSLELQKAKLRKRSADNGHQTQIDYKQMRNEMRLPEQI